MDDEEVVGETAITSVPSSDVADEVVEKTSITSVPLSDGDTKPVDNPVVSEGEENEVITGTKEDSKDDKKDSSTEPASTTIGETEVNISVDEDGELSVTTEYSSTRDELDTHEMSSVTDESILQGHTSDKEGEYLPPELVVTTLDQASIPGEVTHALPDEPITVEEEQDVISSPDRYPYFPIEEHDYSWAQMEEVEMADLSELTKRKLTPIFLALMCRKNKDKTQHLILRGSHLMKNLKRRLCDNDLINVREYLKDNISVISLDLAYNNITSDGLQQHLIPLLQENRVLKELILSNNEICLRGLEAISEISSELCLTSLRLNGNKLGPKSGEALARLLEGSKTLLNLDISETDQNVSSLACIAAMLRRDYAIFPVKRYPFFRRPINVSGDEIAKDPKICSPSQLALYMRHLVNQQKGEEDSGSLLSITSSEKSRINCLDEIDWTLPLKKIKLKTNVSQPLLKEHSDSLVKQSEETVVEDFKCVCQPFASENDVSSNTSESHFYLENKPILEILFLDRILGHYHYQPLTYHFTRILSDMIKANDSLRELHLQKNSLTDSDINVLCQGLKENSTIRLLDLSANHIGCLGLSYIAECIINIKLEALILNHNDISNYGARALFFNLPSTNLKMLDLAHNSISDAGMMDLLYTMRKQPKILALFIWGNPITHISLKKIKEYLVQGWILTDSLDIKIYEVDDILYHAHKPMADPYKDSYYVRPSRHMSCPPPPPHSHGPPLEFQHYDFIYSRNMSKYIARTYLYPPGNSNSCTT